MEKLVVTFFNGLTLTMILSLIALGLAVIFGLRGVINLAHGEFFMLGAYAVVAADLFLPSFWGGFVVAPLAVAGLGWVVERSVISFLYDKPLGHAARDLGFEHRPPGNRAHHDRGGVPVHVGAVLGEGPHFRAPIIRSTGFSS